LVQWLEWIVFETFVADKCSIVWVDHEIPLIYSKDQSAYLLYESLHNRWFRRLESIYVIEFWGFNLKGNRFEVLDRIDGFIGVAAIECSFSIIILQTIAIDKLSTSN
jgi:hypothetical protein